MVGELREAAGGVPGVVDVAEVRARWLRHRLRAEVNVAVDPSLSVGEGHAVAREVNQRLARELSYLDAAVVHVGGSPGGIGRGAPPGCPRPRLTPDTLMAALELVLFRPPRSLIVCNSVSENLSAIHVPA